MNNKTKIWIGSLLIGLGAVLLVNNYLSGNPAASRVTPSEQHLVSVAGQAVNVVISRQSEGFNWWNLVWVGMFGVVVLGVYRQSRRQNSGGDPYAQMNKHLGKRGDLITKVRFADVAGVDPAKGELTEIVEMLKNPQKFHRLGAKIPRGVLLKGPPGTGKTLLASATAGEAGVPFFSVSGSDFGEKLVGVGAARVRSLFEDAKRYAPCIIFFDEIDVLGVSRDDTHSGSDNKQTLNQLLAEMDGLGNAAADVIVLAATNRDEVMDPALLRPGRFDRQVTVPAPDKKGRLDILRVHARKFLLDEAVSLEEIATRTGSMTGAHLATILNEAAIFASRRDDSHVRMGDVLAGIDKVRLGGPLSIVPSEEERLNTARHEAGHAVMANFLGTVAPVTKVSILPRGRSLGITLMNHDHDTYQTTEQELRELLATLMGGRAAETMYYGLSGTTAGASNDLKVATENATAMVTKYGLTQAGLRVIAKTSLGTYDCSPATAEKADQQIEALLRAALSQAAAMLEEKRELVDRLAAALIEKETLEADEVSAILGPKVVKQ